MNFNRAMDPTAARSLIQRCLTRMTALYGSEVFDEWALLAPRGGSVALADYAGPRPDQFRTRFLADVQAVQAELNGRALGVGDFTFALAAEGTAYDACVRVGEGSYLLLNHTSRTMDEVRREATWRQAQRPFVEMCEAFRADPVL
jgi:hypothetical protein